MRVRLVEVSSTSTASFRPVRQRSGNPNLRLGLGLGQPGAHHPPVPQEDPAAPASPGVVRAGMRRRRRAPAAAVGPGPRPWLSLRGKELSCGLLNSAIQTGVRLVQTTGLPVLLHAFAGPGTCEVRAMGAQSVRASGGDAHPVHPPVRRGGVLLAARRRRGNNLLIKPPVRPSHGCLADAGGGGRRQLAHTRRRCASGTLAAGRTHGLRDGKLEGEPG